MRVDTVRLSNFRSYEERTFSFLPDVTVITGKNGIGKTNILEAIYVVLQGKSFRDDDERLLRYDAPWWKVQAELDETERELRYQPGQSVAKQLYINGTSKGRFTYKHQLPVVLFEPDHLLLLHSSPSRRRAYLDTLLLTLVPGYRTTLARYERALLQRNNLLKRGGQSGALRDTIFVWDVALAEHGTAIRIARKQLVDALNEGLSGQYSDLAAAPHTLEIVYEPTANLSPHAFAERLARSFEKDRARGFTSVGPHRDDISFILGGKDAKTTASRGEVRTLVLALKYAELQMLCESGLTSPVFLLDDVFSELDDIRQKALLAVTTGVQKIITTTHAPDAKAPTIIALE